MEISSVLMLASSAISLGKPLKCVPSVSIVIVIVFYPEAPSAPEFRNQSVCGGECVWSDGDFSEWQNVDVEHDRGDPEWF